MMMPVAASSQPRPLAGLRVINTRPADRAPALSAALEAAGAAVDFLPLLEIAPMEMGPEQRRQLMDLDRYQVVFVVSPTAAMLGLELLLDYWPQWPAGVAWVAVGAASAHELVKAGLDPQVPAIETSEGVLALPALNALRPGDRVLVLRGEGGRNLVRDWLQAKSVRVDYLDLYQRRFPLSSVGLWQALESQSVPDAVILTSGESLRHWLALAAGAATRIPAVVISPRLAAQARQDGIPEVVVADGTRPEAIVAALQAWREAVRHGID
ncbi:MAG: uroporphyrinogen-III synthase [Fluviicoccus sp.]|uniref:uroporphyrinogen-III synthase n=1 Tax=Fluviicoccus sp. TaxID=2003552 RepID=UPI00271EA827|nr:uroporphyrinogen-III synthase [Fluviicoccus sp.]MDO8329684.1 uroporphyrinogen-III synthase [Fluviicoccus sp.]